MNRGNRDQVMPGARMRWMVTTKFNPVRIDEKPVIKTARPVLESRGVAEGVL